MGMTRGTRVATRGRGVTKGVEVGGETEGDTGVGKGGAGSKDEPRQRPTTEEG